MTTQLLITPPITAADDALYALAKGSPAPAPTPTPTPIPPDTNVYPLQPPASVPAGSQVSLGTGPDVIRVLANNNQASADAGQSQMQFEILLDGRVLTGALLASVNSGAANNQQEFLVHGSWGPLPHTIGVGTLNSVGAMNVLGVWYDGIQLGSPGANGVYNNSVWMPGAGTSIWVQPSAAPPAPPPPVVTASQITVTINGATKTDTLTNDLTATPTNGVMIIPAGTFSGTGNVPNQCTIQGAGSGKTIISGTGLQLASQGKGVLVPMVTGDVFAGFSVTGNTTAGDGGLREEGDGIAWSGTDLEVYGCTNGIGPSFSSNITLANCYTHDNGAGDGLSHEMYFGGKGTANVVSLTNVNSKCGTKSTHALKSRAGTTKVSGGTFTGSADSTGAIGGSVIDFPDMGACSISGATIITSKGAANILFLGYGLESNANAAPGSTLTLTNVVFTDNTGSGGILQGNAGTKLVLAGCTYTAATAPTIKGFDSVTGAIAPATAPAPTPNPPPTPPLAAFPDRTTIVMLKDFSTVPSMLAYFQPMTQIPIGASKPVWTHPVEVQWPTGEFDWAYGGAPTDKLGWSQDQGGYPLGTTAANNLTYMPIPGQGFRDRADIRTSPLKYDFTRGAAINGTSGNYAIAFIHMDQDFLTIDGLQVVGIVGDQASLNTIIQNCIIPNGVWISAGTGFTMRNCLVEGFVYTSYAGLWVNNTIIGQIEKQYPDQTLTIRNCIIITGGQPVLSPNGVANVTFDHCLTDAPNPPAGCTQLTAAQVTGLFMAAGDYRLATGSAAVGAGIADPVNAAADISGHARATTGAIDVGCWQT